MGTDLRASACLIWNLMLICVADLRWSAKPSCFFSQKHSSRTRTERNDSNWKELAMGFFLNSIPRETTRVSVQCLDIAGRNRALKSPQKHSLSALFPPPQQSLRNLQTQPKAPAITAGKWPKGDAEYGQWWPKQFECYSLTGALVASSCKLLIVHFK